MKSPAKLTESQSMLLSRAARRDDGLLEDAGSMKAATVARVAASLVERKLMREVRGKSGIHILRRDADGRGFSLLITRAGRDAVGVEKEVVAPDVVALGSAIKAGRRAARQANKKERAVAITSATGGGDGRNPLISFPRPGSKQALVIGMLSRDAGATLKTLVAATGWLPHTTRAALTGLRKRGFMIERLHPDGKGTSIYRVAAGAKSAA